MPILKNPRRERIAQLLASGKTATEAHQLAGYKRGRGNASRLATDPEIQDRVQQITAVGAERAAVTVESLISEAEQARRGAMGAGQYAAAVAAVQDEGGLSGKGVERRESGVPGGFVEIENMTAEQLADFIRKQAEES